MFNQEDINNFVNSSDDEIKKRIASAASQGKISPDRIKNLLGDTDKIRKAISAMKPADIERMLKIIGRDNAEKMAKMLKDEYDAEADK